MNIFFSGIGGVGLGPLAEIARDTGNAICGSDSVKSLMTAQLEDTGVAISYSQDGDFLRQSHSWQPIDWFVYTAALPSDHPELLAAQQLGLKISKRDELLSRIIKDRDLKLIAVSGTHGKTTVTGMLIWAFQQLNIPISYSIGTTINFGKSGQYDPKSRYFVYECDEFDRNFLHFSPHLSLITSLNYDHPDTYATEADYYAAFDQFIAQSDQTIMWDRDSQQLHPPASSWLMQADELAAVKLPGLHNRQNASLVLKALEYLMNDDNQAASPADQRLALESFPGTDRRFEKLADNLYSDYGHHPAEIKATLQMARELSDNVVLVYQPHQNIRQHDIKDQYSDQFEMAELIYWLPTYLTRENPRLSILTPEELSAGLSNRQDVIVADFNDLLWQSIQQARQDGKLVLFMGAGAIDNWVRQQLKA